MEEPEWSCYLQVEPEVVQALRDNHAGRDVVLVSKDINMRIKARALGLRMRWHSRRRRPA